MRSASLLLSIILLALLSCGSPAVSPNPIPEVYSLNYWGQVSATRQGIALQNPRIAAASRVPCRQHSFDITITEFDDDGDILTTLTLFNIPKRTCSLTKFKVDYTSLYCGTDTIGSTFTAKNENLLWGTYKPVINAETQLTIQSLDTLSGEVRGTFSVRMVPDVPESAFVPPLLQLKNGKFQTKLKLANGTYKL